MNIKKNIILTLSLALFVHLLNAQELYVGFKGGLNVTNITDDPNNHAKLGAHLGGYFGLKFTEQLGGSIELLYTQKGTHHTNPNPIIQEDYDVMVHIDYIDIPILFHYYFTPAFNIHAGLTIGVPVRGVNVFRYPGYPYRSPGQRYYERRDGILDDIHETVIGFPIGISYEIAQRLNLGLRGDIGLSAIGNDGRKNMVLMLSIGYTFFRKDANLGAGGKKK